MRKSSFLVAVALSAAVAMPASAALTLGSTACALSDITPAASACGGWYAGNLNGGSPTKKLDSAAALNALLGTSAYTGPTLAWLEDLSGLSGGSVNFVTALYGQTVVSFHVGAATGQATGVGYQATAFYRFDAGNIFGGLDLVGFNKAGLSNARLYSTGHFVPPPAVPEPATWGMMLLGFGVVGYAMRRRRSRSFAIA